MVTKKEKLPDILNLLEVARLLCGERRSTNAKNACIETMHRFLNRASTLYNPAKISKKHDLVVFDEGEREMLVTKKFFLHLIYKTSKSRYPKIKACYAKEKFWSR